MKIYCTRPHCTNPHNFFPDLDNRSLLNTVPQKYCTTCGMPLILAGRYLPEKLLGQGGFGAAFLARDRYTPNMRQCVVKQFQPSGNLGPKELEIALQLFTREAEVLEELGKQHHQIPDLYAFFPLIVGNDQFFYLVQEFIDGETLEEELEKKGVFSEQKIIDFFQEMLPVLKFVHTHDSIHRDIKPSNIIRDKKGVLHLLDFGAVKQVTKQRGNNHSSTGIYSQGFAPPEQMAGEQVYPSTDLYALAATSVYLLTGKPIKDLYDFYTTRWKNWRAYTKISDRLANIINLMLEPYPHERPQSAQEVLTLLDYPTTQTPTIPQTPTLTTPTIPTQTTQVPPIPTPSTPTQNIPLRRPILPPLSLTRVFTSAGFLGFETTLFLIVIASFLPFKTALMVLGGFAFVLFVLVVLRVVEKWDFLVIGLISLGLVWWVSPLHLALSIYELDKLVILVFPILVAAAAIAVVALFCLIYKLLYLLFAKLP